jgi:hypothetical protein
MANYKAVANGNWSNLAIWQDNSSGSYIASTVLPGVNDDVYLNNFTVTADIDINVRRIGSDGSVIASADGGIITVNSNRTIAAPNVVSRGSTQILNCATNGITFNFIGNLTVNRNGFNFSNGFNLTGNSTYNFTGNVLFGRSRDNTYGINLTAGTLNLVGNLSRFQTSEYGSEYCLLMSGTSIANITGAVDDDFTDKSSQFVISGAITNVVNIVGSVSTSNFKNTTALAVPAIFGVTLYLSGSATSRLGTPIATFLRYNNSTQNSFTTPTNIALTNQTLYTPGVATGHPATNNVRTGVTYGPTNNLTGTCAVPPSGSVALGVPVDNTVGTAYVDATSLANYLTGSLAAPLATSLFTEISGSSDPLAERIRNQSTIQTTGAQLAGLL